MLNINGSVALSTFQPRDDTMDSVTLKSKSVKWPVLSRGIHLREPLNPDGIMCKFGELPGTWLPHFIPAMRDLDTVNYSFSAPPFGLRMNNITQGSGWQVFDPHCQVGRPPTACGCMDD